MTLEQIKQNLTQDKTRDKEYLLSVYNDFISSCEDKGQISQYLQLLIEHLSEDERKAFFKKVNGSIADINKKIDTLFGEKKWEDLIIYIDENLYKVQMPKVVENRIQYQHPNPLNAIAYSLNHKGEKVDAINHDEFMMLNKKAIAQIKLKKYEQAEQTIKECESLAPENFGNKFQRLEIIKQKGENDKILPFLNELIDDIWYYESFAYILQEYAEFYEKNQQYQTSVYYYLYSLLYDDFNKDIVQEEIEKIRNISKVETKFDRVIISKYFNENNLKFEVSQKSALLAYEIYDCILSYKKFDSALEQLAKKNLIKLYAGATEVAEMIEVKHKTDNKLVVDYNYGFSLQIKKDFNKTDKSTQEKYIQEFSNGQNKFVLEIEKDKCILANQEMVFDRFEKIISEEKNEIVEKYSVELVNGQTVLIIKTKSDAGNRLAFYFRVRPNVVAGIKQNVKEFSEETENNILSIIQTIKFLGEDISEGQKDLYNVSILGKGLSSMNGEDSLQAKKYISSKINGFAYQTFNAFDGDAKIKVAGENLIKLVLLSLINQKASVEAFGYKILSNMFLVEKQGDETKVENVLKSFIDTNGTTEHNLYKDFESLNSQEKFDILKYLSNTIYNM